MSKKILGLAGEIGSGKSTVAQYIMKQQNVSYHRFSNMLRDVLSRLFIEQNRDNLQKVSTLLRQNFGEDLFAKVMMEEVSHDQHDIVLIDGIRRLSDITHLQKLPEFQLIYIEADIKTRYERVVVRGENPDESQKTFEQFQADNQKEAEKQILTLREHAQHVINNDASIEELYAAIDKILAE
jgi:dephospho-CoA kinase